MHFEVTQLRMNDADEEETASSSSGGLVKKLGYCAFTRKCARRFLPQQSSDASAHIGRSLP